MACFSEACIDAEKSIATSPATVAILSRRALELSVKWLYANDDYLNIPYRNNLSSLIHDRSFKDIIEPDLFPLIQYIVKLGNRATHTNDNISRGDGVLTLYNLQQFIS